MSRPHQPQLTKVVPKLRHVYAYFWPDIRPYRGRILAALGALFLSVAFQLLEPWPIKILVDNVLGSQPAESFLGLGWSAKTLLAVMAVAVSVLVAGRALADFVSRVGFFAVGNRVVVKVRDRLFRHVQDLSLAHHTRANTGDQIIRLTRDVSLLRDVTSTAILPLIASTAVLVGMIGMMFYLSVSLTLLALITLPIFWLTTLRISKQIRTSARKQREREGAMATTAAEAMQAIEVIKATGLEERFATLFSRRNASSQKEDFRASRLSVRLSRSIDILLALSTTLVIWFGGQLALQGQMSAGDIIVFVTYLKRSFKPAQEFAKYVARLAKAAAAGERVIQSFEYPVESARNRGQSAAPPFRGFLEFRHVSFAFDVGVPVLRNVTFQAEPGELVALVGPSGSGKTTILRHVLRLCDPDEGAVMIDGQNIQEWQLASVRSQVAVVLQDALLLADTVRENIACGGVNPSDDDILAAIRLSQSEAFIEQLSHGIETKLGERGATLSRGQRQRLAIARAAVRVAPFLLLDEPTTGLDEDNSASIIASLKTLSRDRTTLVATHDLSLAAQADRILFIDSGEIVESGTHGSLLGRRGRYATWFSEQRQRTLNSTIQLTVVSS